MSKLIGDLKPKKQLFTTFLKPKKDDKEEYEVKKEQLEQLWPIIRRESLMHYNKEIKN